MRFRVVVNTHGRPGRALAVVEALRALESGGHEVGYTVAHDLEDEGTGRFFSAVGDWCGWLRLDVAPRPDSLQDVWNRNLRAPWEADWYLPMPDDGFCACPHWDEGVATLGREKGALVVAWHDQANPGQLTVPIVSRRWLELLDGEPLLDPRFPFWFADTAINEVHNFVFGHGAHTAPWLLLAGKPGEPNPIMRDVDLWWDLFAATRVDRLELAAEIRRQLGLGEPAGLAGVLAQCRVRDARSRVDTHEIEGLLVASGRRKAATAGYERLRVAAEERLGR